MANGKANAGDGAAVLRRWISGELVEVAGERKVSTKDFERWMIAEQRRVYLLCLRILRNCDEADSATQDAFLKAFRALEKENNPGIKDASKWLTRIAVNTCLDRLRAKQFRIWERRIPRLDEEAMLQLLPASAISQEDALLSRDIGRRLTVAIDKLSPRQRLVFLLRHEEDCTVEEIGEILSLDSGTVKAHMARAVEKLRKELRDLYGKPALER